MTLKYHQIKLGKCIRYKNVRHIHVLFANYLNVEKNISFYQLSRYKLFYLKSILKF